MRSIDKNDVEKLSRGKPTKSRIGSRQLGHRLTQKERFVFDAAKKIGYLKIPHSGIRKNVMRIYQLWCEAEGRECIIIEASAPYFHEKNQ